MGNMPTANMHTGTIEAALHRIMGITNDSFDRLLPSTAGSYIHSYRVPKSIIDTSTEYLDEAGIEGTLPKNTVQNFNNQEDLKKALPYVNAKEDIGSTSYLLPKKMVGQEIQFMGTAQISDDIFMAAEQRVLKEAGISNFANWDGTIKKGDKTISGSDAVRELKSRALDDIRQKNLSESLVFSQKETYWPGIHPPQQEQIINKTPRAVISNSKAIESVEDNLTKVVAKNSQTKGLLNAARQASAAVAGGIAESDTLRVAAAAATILKKRID
jgi:hypothetical protein